MTELGNIGAHSWRGGLRNGGRRTPIGACQPHDTHGISEVRPAGCWTWVHDEKAGARSTPSVQKPRLPRTLSPSICSALSIWLSFCRLCHQTPGGPDSITSISGIGLRHPLSPPDQQGETRDSTGIFLCFLENLDNAEVPGVHGWLPSCAFQCSTSLSWNMKGTLIISRDSGCLKCPVVAPQLWVEVENFKDTRAGSNFFSNLFRKARAVPWPPSRHRKYLGDNGHPRTYSLCLPACHESDMGLRGGL